VSFNDVKYLENMLKRRPKKLGLDCSPIEIREQSFKENSGKGLEQLPEGCKDVGLILIFYVQTSRFLKLASATMW
jgi:hypothetical protein